MILVKKSTLEAENEEVTTAEYIEHVEQMKVRAQLALRYHVMKGLMNLEADPLCKAVLVEPTDQDTTKVLFEDGIGFRVEIRLDHEPEIHEPEVEVTPGASGSTTTVVWTDGSCNAGGHKGVGGWAALIEQDGTPQVRIVGALEDTSHNRMEITAVIEALEQVRGPIEVRLDSTYVQKCFIEEWHVRWRRDGKWRGANGAVKNRDLWERLFALVEDGTRQITWTWIKGHATEPNNNIVDRLAREAAEKLAAELMLSPG